MNKKNFSDLDHFCYILFVIITLGVAFFYKTMIKKALKEMIDEK